MGESHSTGPTVYMTELDTMTSPLPNATAPEDGPPSAKRQRTNPDDSLPIPSQPLDRPARPGQGQEPPASKDLTLDSPTGSWTISTWPAPSPVGVLPNPGPTPAPHDAPNEGDKPKDTAATTRAPIKFKMKRTGTNGLQPGSSMLHPSPRDVLAISVPKPSISPSLQPSPSSPVASLVVSDILGPEHLRSSLDKVATATPLRQSSTSTTGPSRPTSAGGLATEIVNTASPRSIAMKRKWASGQMDAAAQKAAETRRLNAERRMSVISISDNSTGEPVAKKPSKTATRLLATRLFADQPASTPRTGITTINQGPPSSMPPNPLNDTSHAYAPIKGFSRTQSDRPYNMVRNENGRLVNGFGALFPEGYMPVLGADGKTHQWVCPIRNCNHVRLYLKSHGKHFIKKHRFALLHDNEDGTFTVAGNNRTQDAPVVISRGQEQEAPRDLAPDASAATTGKLESPRKARRATTLDKAKYYVDDQAEIHAGTSIKEAPNGDTFFTTPSGRPYTVYPGNGNPTSGVLIPDGYDRLTSDKTPWVCPIRSCQTSWNTQNGLIIHFGKIHGGCLLKDNLDGTLSVIGSRMNYPIYHDVPGWARKYALVVRQGSVDDAEEQTFSMDQRAERKRQAYPTQDNEFDTSLASDPVQTPSAEHNALSLAPAAEAQQAPTLTAGALETWDYIRPHLLQFTTECLSSCWIRELLRLPKVRDIAWNKGFIAKNLFIDKAPKDVASLVIQVTGDIPPKTCSRCRESHKGPYAECVVISTKAPIDARLSLTACASCLYHGQGAYCSLKIWARNKAQTDAADLEGHDGVHHSHADEDQSTISVHDSPQLQTRHLDRPNVPLLEKAQAEDAARSDPPYIPPHEDPAPPSSPPPRRTTRTVTRQPQQLAAPSLQPTNTDGMAVEDWELAPGRLLCSAPPRNDDDDDDGEPAEAALAYSMPYLTAARQAVRVSADAAFRVDVVGAGESLRWAAAPDRVRVCSVAAGKVRVRVRGEEPFDLGPHGMFRLVPGRECVVVNRLYGDAVLHVCEIADYS